MNIVSHNFDSLPIRTIEKNGQIWFVAKDIASALEYSSTNMPQLFGSVPDEWKGSNPIATLGGEQDMLTITEQGLYFFLGRSDKPKALPFQKWVAGEVIPSIRQTGSYTIEVQPKTDLNTLIEAAKLVLEPAGITGNQLTLSLDRLVKAKTGESVLALTDTKLIAPEQKQLLTPTEIGRPLGLSAIKVNKQLEQLGYQYKTEAGWQPTSLGLSNGAVLLDTGKRHNNGTPVRQLKWPCDIL